MEGIVIPPQHPTHGNRNPTGLTDSLPSPVAPGYTAPALSARHPGAAIAPGQFNDVFCLSLLFSILFIRLAIGMAKVWLRYHGRYAKGMLFC